MKVKLDDGAFAPTRAHETDAGLDIRATETSVRRRMQTHYIQAVQKALVLKEKEL